MGEINEKGDRRGEGGRKMEAVWLRGETTEPKRARECGLIEEENSQRDTITIDIYCSQPPSHSRAALWLVGHGYRVQILSVYEKLSYKLALSACRIPRFHLKQRCSRPAISSDASEM